MSIYNNLLFACKNRLRYSRERGLIGYVITSIVSHPQNFMYKYIIFRSFIAALRTVDEDEDVGAGAAGPIACAEDLDRKLGGGNSAARHHSTKSKRRAGCGGAIQKS